MRTGESQPICWKQNDTGSDGETETPAGRSSNRVKKQTQLWSSCVIHTHTLTHTHTRTHTQICINELSAPTHRGNQRKTLTDVTL